MEERTSVAQTRAIAAPARWRLAPAALFSNWNELGVPIAGLGIVIALITPLPGFVLDGLIVTDIMMSVVVMMVAMYIRKPVEFSVFPTTLLL